MKSHRNRKLWIVIVCSFLSLLFILSIGSSLFKNIQLDFTQENLYTLSKGSKGVLDKLNNPVKLKLYYSKTAANKGTEGIRRFNNYFRYVRDFLNQYVQYSSFVTLEIFDPRPDTVEEEDALSYGLRQFQLTDTEKYFFGLAAISDSGTEKVIEFFDPGAQETLEYDLTKLLFSLTSPRKKVIGVLSSLNVMAEETSPYMMQMMRMQGKPVPQSWMAIESLKEFYEVKKIDPNSTSIEGVDALLVIHPKKLPDTTEYAIDQFLASGKNAFILVDPLAVSDQAGANPMMGGGPSGSDLAKILAQLGLKLTPGKALGDKNLAGVGRTNPSMPSSRLLPLLSCDQRCVAGSNSPVSSSLKDLLFLVPGELVFDEKNSNVKLTSILQTTTEGNTYDANPYMLNSPSIAWNQFKKGDAVKYFGVQAITKYKSAYSEAPQKKSGKDSAKKTTAADTDSANLKSHIQQASEESSIFVIADVDFINDQFSFRRSLLGVAPSNDNSALFLNVIEGMVGSKDLMEVRSKGRFTRPFLVVDRIEEEAEIRTKEKVTQINRSITNAQQELAEMGKQANSSNYALLKNESLRKKKELSKQIGKLKKELRAAKREGRESIESLGKSLKLINTLLVPFLLIILYFLMHKRRKLEDNL